MTILTTLVISVRPSKKRRGCPDSSTLASELAGAVPATKAAAKAAWNAIRTCGATRTVQKMMAAKSIRTFPEDRDSMPLSICPLKTTAAPPGPAIGYRRISTHELHISWWLQFAQMSLMHLW